MMIANILLLCCITFVLGDSAIPYNPCKPWEILKDRIFEPSCALDAYQRQSDDELCTCKPGYVRKTPHFSHGKWECIKREQCVCGPLEEFGVYHGVYGCYCKPGYVRGFENQCVPEDWCPGENEIYSVCTNCPPRVFCFLPCTKGCMCKEGYVRDFGICVEK